MRLFQQACLLAGLMPFLSRAAPGSLPTANMGIWLIDESCSNYHDGETEDTTGMTGGSDQRPYVQELFTGSLRITMAAQQSLKYVLGKRPIAKSDPKGYQKWVRIAESLAVTLGIVPNPSKVESASDDYWNVLFEIYDRTVSTLQSSKNYPEKGFNPTLAKLSDGGPLIVCGDNWDWYGDEDDYPGTTTKMSDVPSIQERLDEEGALGGWYKHHRWVFEEGEKTKPILCDDQTLGLAASTYSLIAVCDAAFTSNKYKKAWPSASAIKAGYKLQDIALSTQAVVTHELYHWFSGLDESDSDSDTDMDMSKRGSGAGKKDVFTQRDDTIGNFALDDVPRVDEDGFYIYTHSDGSEKLETTLLTDEEEEDQELSIGPAYTVRDVWNLAKRHTGATKDNSGPAKATNNAESLTMFGIMMYFDQWDWSHQGKARTLQ